MRAEIADKLDIFQSIGQEVFLEDAKPPPSMRENVKGLFSRTSPRSHRVWCALRIVKAALPEKLRKLSPLSYDFSELPFALDATDPAKRIGSGSANRVFLLNSKSSQEKSYVLKVPLFRKAQVAHELANKEKAEYEEIRSIFAPLLHIIPTEHYLVVKDPVSKRPASATIQEFIGGDIYDIFTEVPRANLHELLAEKQNIRQDLHTFVGIMDANEQLYKKQLDLLGLKNLSVVANEKDCELVFLDTHYRSEGGRTPKRESEIRERVAYLKDVLDGISETPAINT